MTSVDDTIWAVITCDSQAAMALAVEQSPPPRRRPWIAAVVVLCLLVAMSAVLFRGGSDHAAYALAVEPDGTIVLTLSEVEGIDGANSQLAHMGTPVRVARLLAGCTESGEPDRSATPLLPSIVEPASGRSGTITWRIHPSAIPAGDTMLLEAQTLNGKAELVGYRAMLYRGSAPSCLPPAGAG